MKKVIKALGITCVAVIGLTSCGMGSLPHDERYAHIDRVLSDIDYQNIGTVVHEEIDNGDGIFIPSYKRIYYEDSVTFEKIFSKLRNAPDDVKENCSELIISIKEIESETQVNCTYYGNAISLGRGSEPDEYGAITRIKITDAMSGKNN